MFQVEANADLPDEIAAMDDRSIQLFKEAMKEGKYKSYFLRVMVVGHFGVGKTTLTKRILNEEVDLHKTESTEGIEIYIGRCLYNAVTKHWIISSKTEGNFKSEKEH